MIDGRRKGSADSIRPLYIRSWGLNAMHECATSTLATVQSSSCRRGRLGDGMLDARYAEQLESVDWTTHTSL